MGLFLKEPLLGQVLCGPHSGLCASRLGFVTINRVLSVLTETQWLGWGVAGGIWSKVRAEGCTWDDGDGGDHAQH